MYSDSIHFLKIYLLSLSTTSGAANFKACLDKWIFRGYGLSGWGFYFICDYLCQANQRPSRLPERYRDVGPVERQVTEKSSGRIVPIGVVIGVM
jgi:hypothetical protein